MLKSALNTFVAVVAVFLCYIAYVEYKEWRWKPPPPPPATTVIKESDSRFVLAELAESATSEDDIAFVYQAIVNAQRNHPGLEPETIFKRYWLHRAPSDEGLQSGFRDPDFVREKGDTWLWWPGRAQAKARYARAQKFLESVLAGDQSYLTRLPPAIKCVEKIIRVWPVNTARTDENKMKKEMRTDGDGFYLNPSTGFRAFCPKSTPVPK